MSRILLATQSPYKKQLFERLQLPFETCNPDIDEGLEHNEPAEHAVLRLARLKAEAAAVNFPNSEIIVAGDQLAAFNGQAIGKSGSRESAIAQLKAFSDNSVDFFTGICLIDQINNVKLVECERFSVEFRSLGTAEIERYVDAEQPFDCAGSFKCEGLGIALFKKMIGDDPTSLIGLPLIKTANLLRQLGVSVP